MINSIILIGHLTKNIVIKHLPANGSPFAILSVANNRKIRNGEQWIERTCFIEARIYGSLAISCKQYLKKGSKVGIKGILVQTHGLDKKSRQKREKHFILVEMVQFLDPKSKQARPPTLQVAEEEVHLPFYVKG